MTIPKLTLDNDQGSIILERAIETVQDASNGTLTDFEPYSPVVALLEGQVFAIEELLWYANQLPEAIALEAMRYTGISRNLGTKARGNLTFLLTSTLANNFSVPAGYVVSYRDLSYVLLNTLFIPSGAIQGTVAVEAVEVGSRYNLPRLGFSNTALGLNFVNTVYNEEAITGGTDLEPLEDTLARIQQAIRTKDSLVTAIDYELAAQALVPNTRAYAIPKLASNKSTIAPGQVHVFMVNSDSTAPTTSTLAYVKQELDKRIFAGSSVWVSPVDLLEVQVTVSVSVESLSYQLALDVLNALADYLRPRNFPLGGTLRIKELEYVVRDVEGINRLLSTLQLNAATSDVSMPNVYTLPVLGLLNITQTDTLGLTQTWNLGLGLADPE